MSESTLTTMIPRGEHPDFTLRTGLFVCAFTLPDVLQESKKKKNIKQRRLLKSRITEMSTNKTYAKIQNVT